jgi:prevent-host-death family protein
MGERSTETRATVGARELKTRLGGYLRQVQGGKVLTITERGIPVARLSPILQSERGMDDVIDDLANQGLVTKREVKGLPVYRALESRDESIDETIRKDREDRF